MLDRYSALQVLVLCGCTLNDLPFKANLIRYICDFDVDISWNFVHQYIFHAMKNLKSFFLNKIRICIALGRWIQSRQNDDGSFSGDEFGSRDSRFSYCALACLALLKSLDSVNIARAVSFVLSCKSADGGFAMQPGAEAHAGQTFCCIASLAICEALHHVVPDQTLSHWLSERQNTNGGMNGRPGKKSDTCYSWWVGASCCILGKPQLIDWSALASFVIDHQSHQGMAIRYRHMYTILTAFRYEYYCASE